MKFIEVKLSRLIPGPPGEVFDVWFDPESPGGPWYGAKKAIMNLVVDGMFYFGIERAIWQQHTGATPVHVERSLLGHFGRFTAIERPRVAEHTWMSENTLGIETTVLVTFEPRDGGTQMTILHRGVPDDERGRKHEGGWTYLMSRLENEFTSKR
jgi:uncharacterized protein YndB with AHSA1/START domain